MEQEREIDHILIATETASQVNGVATTIHNWAREFSERGIEVTVLHPENHLENPDIDIRDLAEKHDLVNSVEVYSLPFRIGEEYFASPPILLAVKGELPGDIDVVHSMTPFGVGGHIAPRIAKKLEIPYVQHYHTPLQMYTDYVFSRFPNITFPRKGLIRRLVERLLDWSLRLSEKFVYNFGGIHRNPPDKIFAPTEEAAEILEDRTGAEVETLSNGIDTDRFSPGNEAVSIRNDEDNEILVDQEDDILNLLYVGRIGWEKNLDDLVDLSDRVEENTRILVSGSGGETGEIVPGLKEAGIEYLGFVEDEKLPALMENSDVLLQPSTVETQGLTVLEANGCGSPAVGADARALKKTIKQGVNGFRYEPGNIEELVQKIQEAVSTDELEPRNFVIENHSVEVTVERLIEIYTGLSERKKNNRAKP